ncbi:MAG: alpha/beta fold hydrolase [Burkholderiales bacterium]|nr:alpha/beta fold hydrolase [Burkholderiales bacterium]MBH2017296.1 alpha/beta fold hydrolase [Burkholderiales bacterium]
MTRGTWVLLRGLTREQGHWGGFPKALQAALPEGSEVLTPDLPGNGAWCHERSPASVGGLVEAIRAQLQAAGAQPPYHVLAMSLGAMVTVEWAHRHPQELRDAVLINTSLKPHSPFWRRLQARQYPRILRLLLGPTAPRDWEEAIMQMTTRHPAHAQAALQHWLALRQAHPVSTANGLRQLWAAASYRSPRQAPPVPVLLLNGAGDRLVHPSCSAVLASRWGAPLITHPTAGHDLPLDAGEWVVQQVQRWQQRPTLARA